MSAGLVCNSALPSTEEICQLETRSIHYSDKCHRNTMLSHHFLNREMPSKGTIRTSITPTDSTNLVHSAVVSLPVTASRPRMSRPTLRPIQHIPPPNRSSVSRLENIRETTCRPESFRKVSKLILAEWSNGTNTAYQSAWSQWSSWCHKRKINPISCYIQFFLDFLVDLFEQGLQHRTINLICFAVSMTHNLVEGVPIGNKAFKGVYNSQPPQPRYTTT